jgi:hypothetical protein
VRQGEERQVDIRDGRRIGRLERQVGVREQMSMEVRDGLPRVRIGRHPGHPHRRMDGEIAEQLGPGVAGGTQDGNVMRIHTEG